MSLEVVSKDFEITPAIKDHAEKSVAKLQKLDRVNVTSRRLSLKKDGSKFVSEYVVHANIGEFFARAEDQDCYKSISAVVTKLYEQIKKQLEKLQH